MHARTAPDVFFCGLSHLYEVTTLTSASCWVCVRPTRNCVNLYAAVVVAKELVYATQKLCWRELELSAGSPMPERSKDWGLAIVVAGRQVRQPVLRLGTPPSFLARQLGLAASVRTPANLLFGFQPAAEDFSYLLCWNNETHSYVPLRGSLPSSQPSCSLAFRWTRCWLAQRRPFVLG